MIDSDAVTRHLAGRIRLRRQQRGLTRQALADRMGVQRAQLEKLETGRVGVSAARLHAIAVALATPHGWFYAGLPGGDGAEAVDPKVTLSEDLLALVCDAPAGTADLLRAVLAFARGLRPGRVARVSLPPSLAAPAPQPADEPPVPAPPAPALTARQHAVFTALLTDRSMREIAADLGITVGTLKVHVTAVLRAKGVANRAELRARALADGAV